MKPIVKLLTTLFLAAVLGAAVLAAPAFAKGVPTNSTNSADGIQVDYSNRNLAERLEKDEGVHRLWNTMLRLADAFVILFLVAVSFATILHINYDTYGVKKAFFPLLIGIILAHFSLFIVRNFVDFANVLTVGLFNAASGGSGTPQQFAQRLAMAMFDNTAIGYLIRASTATAAAGGAAALITAVLGGTFGVLLGGVVLVGLFLTALIILLPAILILILSFLLYIRAYLLLFLTIIAPLAWLAIWWSPVQGFFKKWWGQFTMWLFMAPAVMFFLWVAIEISKATTQATTQGNSANFGTYLLTVMMLYLSITMPFKMGGAVMNAWGGWGKKASAVGLGAASGWGNTMLDRLGTTKFGQRLGVQAPRSTLAGLKKGLEEKQVYAKSLAEEKGSAIGYEGWGTSALKPVLTLGGGRVGSWISKTKLGKGAVQRIGQGQARETEAANRRVMEGAHKIKDTTPNIESYIAGASQKDREKALQYLVGAHLDKTKSPDDRKRVEKAFYANHYKSKEKDKSLAEVDKEAQYASDSNVQGMLDQAKKTTDPFAVRSPDERRRAVDNLTARDKAELVGSYQTPLVGGSENINAIVAYLQKINQQLASETNPDKQYNVGGQSLKLAQYKSLIAGELRRFEAAQQAPETKVVKPIISDQHGAIDNVNLSGDLRIGGSIDLVRAIDKPTAEAINGSYGTAPAREFLEEVKKDVYRHLDEAVAPKLREIRG